MGNPVLKRDHLDGGGGGFWPSYPCDSVQSWEGLQVKAAGVSRGVDATAIEAAFARSGPLSPSQRIEYFLLITSAPRWAHTLSLLWHPHGVQPPSPSHIKFLRGSSTLCPGDGKEGGQGWQSSTSQVQPPPPSTHFPSPLVIGPNLPLPLWRNFP